jgi:membrane protease YdiL (CAAX protease family)
LENKSNSLPFLIFGIALIAVSALVCAVLRVSVETRLWEFPVDLRIAAALALACYAIRGELCFYLKGLGLGKLEWGKIISSFCAPAVLLASLILIGYLERGIEFQGVENSSTFCLSAILDLPAFFFFSAATTLVEEVAFRGIIFQKLSDGRNHISAALLASLLWAALRITDLQNVETASLFSVISHYLYFGSLGILLARVFTMSGSIWVTYSFRIGMSTFASLLLNTAESDSNSFFLATSSLFGPHGIGVAILLCLIAVILCRVPNSAK